MRIFTKLLKVLRSRSIFDRLRLQVFFFTGSGSSFYKKEGFQPLKNVFNSHSFFLTRKMSSIYKYWFFNSLLSMVELTKRISLRICLFYLRWSRSRTFKPAPASTIKYRLRPAPAPQHWNLLRSQIQSSKQLKLSAVSGSVTRLFFIFILWI